MANAAPTVKAALFPHLDLRVPFRSTSMPLSSGHHVASGRIRSPIDGYLLRLNVRPRRAATITYMSRFAYTLRSASSQGAAIDGASTATAASSSAAAAPQRPRQVAHVDASTRSVLRLKPHHVAAVLYALHGGVHSPQHGQRPTWPTAWQNARDGSGGRPPPPSTVAVALRDEMFDMRVECASTIPQSGVGVGVGGSAALPVAQCLRFSGTTWREGFTSCDAWVDATPDRGSGTDRELDGTRLDGHVFASPALELTDAAQLVAMRTFLEGALLASFDF